MISPYLVNHSSKYLCPVYKDIAQISMALRGSKFSSGFTMFLWNYLVPEPITSPNFLNEIKIAPGYVRLKEVVWYDLRCIFLARA